jgi:hypothetical protein
LAQELFEAGDGIVPTLPEFGGHHFPQPIMNFTLTRQVFEGGYRGRVLELRFALAQATVSNAPAFLDSLPVPIVCRSPGKPHKRGHRKLL